MTFTKSQDNRPAPSLNEHQYRKLVTSRGSRPVTTSRKVAELFGRKYRKANAGDKERADQRHGVRLL